MPLLGAFHIFTLTGTSLSSLFPLLVNLRVIPSVKCFLFKKKKKATLGIGLKRDSLLKQENTKTYLIYRDINCILFHCLCILLPLVQNLGF